MRLPYRKPGKYSQQRSDPMMTEGKFNELKKKLQRLQTINKPQAVAEVQRLSQTGDFSENAAYQLAKGRLRGIHQRILEIENQLRQAQIIKIPRRTDTVQIGSTVTVETDGKQKTYTILGSSETNPAKGIISHTSPIGSALLEKKVGDTISMHLAGKETHYTIITIT